MYGSSSHACSANGLLPAQRFISSVRVVEANCKVVVGQRLKQSGMLWSRKGAEHLLGIRCALLSGWFEEFWKAYAKSGRALAFAA